MKFSTFMILVLALTLTAASAAGQSTTNESAVKATPAYEILILRRADVRAELERVKTEHTPYKRNVFEFPDRSEHPAYKRNALEFELLNRKIEEILATPEPQIAKLSAVYGQVSLRIIALRVEEYTLRHQVTLTCPEMLRRSAELQLTQQELEALLR